MSDTPYDIVIGLEIHVQLQTQSKLFCGCSTKFGAPPNTQTCPVCTGMPGSLPVMNRRAFELGLRTAVALNCQIAPFTKWDRKNYYYPDLPKGYQISQFDLPFSFEGWLDISDPKGKIEPRRIGIIRAHLEEDAGKSMHDEAAGQADSKIDLNRTGTPLLEIVSKPDMRSPAEAKAFLTELKLLLTYLEVSDCNMQEGSLRVDANVNLHIPTPEGKIATPIVEIKNMNSFRAVERALDYEAPRQYREWQETGRQLGDAPKQTRGWDDVAGVTRGQRSKEESSDYRYFPDPDLAPVITTAAEVDAVRESLGELPADLRQRLTEGYGLSLYDADVIVNQGRSFVDYYLITADTSGNPKSASNWLTVHVQRELNQREQTIVDFDVPATNLAELIRAVDDGALPSTRAAEAFQLMLAERCDIAAALAKLKIERVDESALIAMVQELLVANPKTVADIQNGKLQAAASLIGQAKKKNPNVDPNRVRELAIELASQGGA